VTTNPSGGTLTQQRPRRGFEHFDGGGSREIRDEVAQELASVRRALGCDAALLLRSSSAEGVHLLGCSGDSVSGEVIPNEVLTADPRLEGVPARRYSDLRLRSCLRVAELRLVDAMVLLVEGPPHLTWLVVSGPTDLPARDVEDITRACVAEVRNAYRISGLRGAARLERELASATRRLAEADDHSGDLSRFLREVVLVTREVLETSACYVSISDETGEAFQFRASVNMRTNAFGDLRVVSGEGLGGIACAEGRAVWVADYAHDRRLLNPTLREAAKEGFESVMCAPIVIDGLVAGVLYVANRMPTAFTPTDTELLEELVEVLGTRLRRVRQDHRRRIAERQRDRDDLAYALHETVVRSLVEIGYGLEACRDMADDPELAAVLDGIADTTSACLRDFRAAVAEFSAGGAESHIVTLGEVIEAFRTAGSRQRLVRKVEVHGASASSVLAGEIAYPLMIIGEEAIENAERHSGGNLVAISIAVLRDGVVLRVSDDGIGFGPGILGPGSEIGPTHLGLFRMRAAAHEVGGTVTVRSDAGGGVRVEARLPLLVDRTGTE